MRHEYNIGQIYGMKRLEMLMSKDGRTVAKVKCINCGKISFVRPCSLFQDKYTSCTCKLATRNGDSKSKLYGIYHNMKYRCYTPTAHEFCNYGGRGIKVDDKWLGNNGYMNFKKWALENGYKDGLTIDRIDSNLNYSPDNCRWTTLSENVSLANMSRRVQHRKANNGVYFCISPSGEYIEFENANQFAYNNSLNPARVRAAANNFRSYKGYKFGFVKFLQDLEPQSTIENAVLPQRVEYENGETPFSEAPSIER